MLVRVGILVLATGIATLGGVLAYYGVRQIQFNRSLDAVEQRSIADVARADDEAFAYVNGTVEPVEGASLVAAPFTGTGCVAYEVAVQQKRGSSRDGSVDEINSSWGPYDRDRDHCRFLLDDGSGAVAVDPTDADLKLATDHEHVSGEDGPAEGPYREYLETHDVYTFDDVGVSEVHEERFVERRIEPGDRVYVTGDVDDPPGGFSEAVATIRSVDRSVDSPFVLADEGIEEGTWEGNGGIAGIAFGVLFFVAGVGFDVFVLHSILF